ncbi:unnamed protein product [Discosporangium mesarthrocarpum]
MLLLHLCLHLHSRFQLQLPDPVGRSFRVIWLTVKAAPQLSKLLLKYFKTCNRRNKPSSCPVFSLLCSSWHQSGMASRTAQRRAYRLFFFQHAMLGLGLQAEGLG